MILLDDLKFEVEGFKHDARVVAEAANDRDVEPGAPRQAVRGQERLKRFEGLDRRRAFAKHSDRVVKRGDFKDIKHGLCAERVHAAGKQQA